jgi:hypothetical protein
MNLYAWSWRFAVSVFTTEKYGSAPVRPRIYLD